ncbi:hypothetical protein FHX64_000499 [Microbacter margulisiae]|uniref:Uncharacterized protein n=1 Tax=Microbacter margulisiae TaxID=1350067 RepID=A0A7W5H1G5_9PORP|nr:hypothetical protein [Microbacter margulisiae]
MANSKLIRIKTINEFLPLPQGVQLVCCFGKASIFCSDEQHTDYKSAAAGARNKDNAL